MTAAFSFGPLGAMTDLVVAPGVAPESGRDLSEFVTSGGVRYSQRTRRNPRRWAVSRVYQHPSFVKLLARASHGLLGVTYLYDRAIARQNLIPAHQSAGDGAQVVVDGAPMGAVRWPSIRVALLAGRAYTVSCWSPDDASPLSAKEGSLPAVPLAAPVNGLSSLTLTPATDTVLTLQRLNNQTVAGIRVHEGIPDGAFYATAGTPSQVAVSDPKATYQLVTDTATSSDYAVDLIEVGLPGVFPEEV